MAEPKLVEPLDAEFEAFMQRAQKRIAQVIQDEAGSILSTVYTDYAMWTETDAWTNYREHLKRELAGGLYRSVTNSEDGHWAKRIRDMIFHEHRAELESALLKDKDKEIEELKLHIEDMRKWAR